MSRRMPYFLFVLFIVLYASPALASMTEYYTYGGFNPVSTAFSNIASIFGDSSYGVGVKTFAMAGVLMGIGSAIMGVYTRNLTPTSWVMGFIPGVMLYTALFVPTTTLSLYDPVLNQNTMIGGLPTGVVYAASFVNHIERFVIQILDTNAPVPPSGTCGPLAPMNYADNGGAVGPRLLQSTLTQYTSDANASATMTNYINDCVSFELVRPGTSLDINMILTPGCDETMLDVLGYAANPANYTIDIMDFPPAGQAATCAAVYAKLDNYYSQQSSTSGPVSNACAGVGFTDMTQCQNLMTNMFTSTLGVSLTPTQFISNNTIAAITSQALSTWGSQSSAQYWTMLQNAQNGTSSGWVSGITNPYMIDAYVAYSIMLFPLLGLLVPTPMWRKVVTLMLSLIFWTALLRSLDVITFHFWANYYQQAVASALNNSGMGMAASLRLPNTTNQYLNYFSNLRNSIFLLATAISGALFHFGDSAMSRLADRATMQNSEARELSMDPGKATQKAMEVETQAARNTMLSSMANSPALTNMARGVVGGEILQASNGYGAVQGSGQAGAANLFNLNAQSSAVENATKVAKGAVLTTPQGTRQGTNDGSREAATVANLDAKTAYGIAAQQTQKNIGDQKGYEKAYEVAQQIDPGIKNVTDFQDKLSFAQNVKATSSADGLKSFVEAKAGGNYAKGEALLSTMEGYGLMKNSDETQKKVQDLGHGDESAAAGREAHAAANSAYKGVTEDEMRQKAAAFAGTGELDFIQKQSGMTVAGFSQKQAWGGTAYERVTLDKDGNAFKYDKEQTFSGDTKEGRASILAYAKHAKAEGATDDFVKGIQNMAHHGKGFTAKESGTVDHGKLHATQIEGAGGFGQTWHSDSSTHRGATNIVEHKDNNIREKLNLDSEGKRKWRGDVSQEQHINTTESYAKQDVVDPKTGDHTSQYGFMDRHGHFVGTDGDTRQVLTDERVRSTGLGPVVARASGDRYDHNVSITGQGGKKLDVSSGITFGDKAAVSVQNVNAVLATKGWTDGNDLDPGKASIETTMVTRGLEKASETIGTALNLAGAPGRGADIAKSGSGSGSSTAGQGATGRAAREWMEYYKRSGHIPTNPE